MSDRNNCPAAKMPRGLTLVELLVWLAISLTLSSLALPTLQRIVHRSQATAQITWLVSAVHYTRHAAVNYRATTTLCPSKVVDKGCNGRWHEGLLVFIDHNQDGRMNGADRALSHLPALNTAGTIIWRSFRNRQYLQMTEKGHTNYQNGHFIYCPANGGTRFARKIVINVQGRARLYYPKDQPSHAQDLPRTALRC
jgi:type IV fimbrial biogenesis protein FimT